jgi:hypothetical protein
VVCIWTLELSACIELSMPTTIMTNCLSIRVNNGELPKS